MKKLLTSLFIFALALNLLLIGSAAPVHGQDQLPPCDELGADQTPDPGVNCEDANKGLGNNPDRCDADNPGNGDECPTDEPTDAPTDEPADAPTDEPADAPTDEPADAPTDEPTDAPTDEPTDEPAAEPTDEPAAEPTDEPVAEPTDEPVAEPTDELTTEPTDEEVPADDGATDQAVPDEGKTDETVVDDGTGIGADTPAVIGSQEGEIGDAAVVGTWTTRFIGIQNLGTSQASVNLDLRTHSQVSNAIAQTIGSKTIFKDGSIVILPGEITSAGSYGGVLSSDQSLAAAVLNDNNTYGTADLYLGTATPSQKVNLPKVFRHHFGITSKFAIQNAYSSAQDITVKAYAIGNGSPVATKTYSNVPANAAFVIDFANDSDYAALTAGDNTGSGAATVEGSAGPVAVVVDSIQDQDSLTGDQKQYYYNGIPDSDAGTVLIHAKAFSNHFGLFSGVAVSNITANTTNVTVKFITDGLGTATSAPKQLLAYESKSFFLPSESVPQGNGASGSIVITSDNSTANIVAVITSARDATSGGTGSQTPAISQDALSITKNIAVPLVFGTSINSWQTGVGVYAVDAGTISATFVKGGVDPTVAGNFFSYNNGAIGAGQITNFYVPGLAGFDQSLTGAVFIQSTGRIIALTTYDMGDSLGSMPGQNY